jgi:3-oxoadipate enol-lactonase
VRDVPGPPGAPTIVLLHGLGATAALNWPVAAHVLSSDFHVVSLDQRGHGRGIRSARPFRLEDCADDVVALADVLGIDQVVAAGYSMGGPVALLARRRHPDRIAGMVLCATSAVFTDDSATPSPFMTMAAASLRLTAPFVRRQIVPLLLRWAGDGRLPPGFVEEVRRHDPAAIIEATQAVRRFDARPWVGDLRAPAAVVLTERDRYVAPGRQLQLARATGASIHPLAADHDVAMRNPGRFLPVLADACRAVTNRAPRDAAR